MSRSFCLHYQHPNSSYYDLLGDQFIGFHSCLMENYHLHNKKILLEHSPIVMASIMHRVHSCKAMYGLDAINLSRLPSSAHVIQPLAFPLVFENATLIFASGPLFTQNSLACLIKWLILVILQDSAYISEAFPDHTISADPAPGHSPRHHLVAHPMHSWHNLPSPGSVIVHGVSSPAECSSSKTRTSSVLLTTRSWNIVGSQQTFVQ